jgi:fibronectin-binding autotransporter adhesin
MHAGILVAYAKPRLEQGAPASVTTVRTHQVGAYGRYRSGALRIDALAAAAVNDTTSARVVTAGGLTRTAQGDRGGHAVSLQLEAGYSMRAATIEIEPYAALAWTRQRDEGYTESGAGALNLTVQAGTVESLRSTLGVRVARSFEAGSTRTTLEGRAAWAHEHRGSGAVNTSLAADPTGTAFSVATAASPRDSLVLGLGVAVETTRNLRFYADLTLDRNGSQSVHVLGAGLRYRW